MSKNILIAPASWEDRFEDGVYFDIDDFKPSMLIVPFSERYAERTLSVRDRIRTRSEDLGIIFLEYEVNYLDQVSSYNKTMEFLDDCVSNDNTDRVRLNASTTPRELVWYILHYLSCRLINSEFSYFKPESYTDDYLSRDAESPRLVIKSSGIVYPDLPTCILVISGYDHERLLQLKQRYEPKKMIIGRQVGTQFSNEIRNFFDVIDDDSISFIDFDAYDISKNSVDKLCKEIDSLDDNYNIIAASLGPKPSAVTLFQLTKKRPVVGLVYIPAGDYSENYSSGIEISSRILKKLEW
jgi:hypothetical protein